MTSINLSLRPNYSTAIAKVKVSCKVRPCPCLEKDPDFCEVLVNQPTFYQRTVQSPPHGCKDCITALAAEQDGICDQARCSSVTFDLILSH